MKLIDVDVVGLQSFETGFTLFDDVAAAAAGSVGIVVVHSAMNLGRKDNAAAAAIALQCLTCYFLAAAATVDVSSIQEVDAGIQRPVDDIVGVFRCCSPPKVHTSQAKGTDFHAGPTEIAVLHVAPRSEEWIEFNVSGQVVWA